MSKSEALTRQTDSYAYVLKFLSLQIRLLQQPFTLDEDILSEVVSGYRRLQREEATKRVKRAVLKVNALLSSHYRRIFTHQALDSLALQIISNEKSIKLSSLTRIKSSHDFLVPLIHSAHQNQLTSTSLKSTLDIVARIPDVKYLEFDQLPSTMEAVNDEDDNDDELQVVEEVEVKKVLKKYVLLRAQLNLQRLQMLQKLQKLEYYRDLNRKVQDGLLGGGKICSTGNYRNDDNDNNNGDTRRRTAIAGIQANLITSKSEIFDEVAKLRVNLGILAPKIKEIIEKGGDDTSFAVKLRQQKLIDLYEKMEDY